MLRAILLLLMAAMYCLPAQAQDLDQNLDKYWSYRDRLVEQFMVVGSDQGMSMPAEHVDTINGIMKWGDNTIWLGWYIGVLSTEYSLLHDPFYANEYTTDTARINQNLNELYHAINGLVRLDRVAEVDFEAPCDSLPDVRNGFFIRDDVPHGFESNFPGINSVPSDYNDPNQFINEMSQDQCYHIFLGVALAKKFLPDSLEVNGMYLKETAIEQGLLIADWMHRDDWTIKNPVCNYKDVARGAEAILLAKGTSKAIQYISDGAMDYSGTVPSFAGAIWDGLTNPSVFVNIDNLHMTMTIAAIGKGFGPNTLDDLMVIGESNRWHAYTLLHAALWDTTGVSNYSTHKPEIFFWADSMLNEAPVEGPYSTYPDTNSHGYSQNNRFIRGREKHYVGSAGSDGWLRNGIDYMLLHNLSWLVGPWKVVAPVGIDDVGPLQVFVYPNPVTDLLHIRLPRTEQQMQITIIDMLGKVVLQKQVPETEVTLDMSELSNGAYALQLQSGNISHQQMLLKR